MAVAFLQVSMFCTWDYVCKDIYPLNAQKGPLNQTLCFRIQDLQLLLLWVTFRTSKLHFCYQGVLSAQMETVCVWCRE